MTRKHFIRLAAAISCITDDSERRQTAQRIGDVCADANPFFDWARWDDACGVAK